MFKIEQPSVWGTLFADDYWGDEGYVYLAPWDDGDSSTNETFIYIANNWGAEIWGNAQTDMYGNAWTWSEGGQYADRHESELDKLFGFFEPTVKAAMGCDNAGQMFWHTAHQALGAVVMASLPTALNCAYSGPVFFQCWGGSLAAVAITAFGWYGLQDVQDCIRYTQGG